MGKTGWLTYPLILTVVLVSSGPAFGYWQLTPVTDNSFEDRNVRIDDQNGNLVWTDNDNQILYFWDHSTTTPVDTGFMSGYDVDGAVVVYALLDSGTYEIFRWQSGVSTQMTSDPAADISPKISTSNICWERDYTTVGQWEIMLYDGATTTQLTTNSYSDQGAIISGNDLFWLASNPVNRVYRYDGLSIYPVSGVSDYASDSMVPDSDGDHAVWIARYGAAGDDREIVYYDGSTAIRLTDNSVDDYVPKLCGSRVVWQGRGGTDGGSDYEIFVYDGTISQITENDVDDSYPDISANLVVWNQTISTFPQEIAVMAYDGILVSRVTPQLYTPYKAYLYGSTVIMELHDGSDHEIVTAEWYPDPTITPTQTPTEFPTATPTDSPTPAATAEPTVMPTTTPFFTPTPTQTPTPPPIPTITKTGVVLLMIFIGIMMIASRRLAEYSHDKK